MRQIRNVKSFNGSYGELEGAAVMLLTSIERDTAHFNDLGITPAKVQQFRDDLQAFKQYRHDRTHQLVLRQINERITSLFQLVEQNYQDFLMRLQLHLGAQATESWYFVIRANKNKQRELIRLYGQNFQELRVHLPQLEGGGITNEWLDQQELILEELSQLLANRHKVENLRDLATQERYQLALIVYNQITTFCQLGKTIAKKQSSPAHLNDYTIKKLFLRKDTKSTDANAATDNTDTNQAAQAS